MEVARRRSIGLFLAVAVLVVSQVAWWMVVFLDDVKVISELRGQVMEHRLAGTPEGERMELAAREGERIERNAFRRRLMFLSEGITFAALSCFGLYLLYRAFQFEARARATERNFIEVVTHESKTPLTAMKLRLESMLPRISNDEAASRDVRLALEEVRRLSSIFEKAMSLNRVERADLSFDTISVSEAIRQVIRRIEPLLVERGVKTEYAWEDEALVKADLFALGNAIQSLMENAVLYNSNDPKWLSVRVERREGRVQIKVSDNGPGIDERDRSRIFERFYRGKQGSSAAPVPGTGLGLYLARTLVLAHQGDLRLNRTGPDGSEFVIDLPEARV